jgi:hypothetical protein
MISLAVDIAPTVETPLALIIFYVSSGSSTTASNWSQTLITGICLFELSLG